MSLVILLYKILKNYTEVVNLNVFLLLIFLHIKFASRTSPTLLKDSVLLSLRGIINVNRPFFKYTLIL